MPVGEAPETATIFPPKRTTGGLVAQVDAVQNAVPVTSSLVGTPVDE